MSSVDELKKMVNNLIGDEYKDVPYALSRYEDSTGKSLADSVELQNELINKAKQFVDSQKSSDQNWGQNDGIVNRKNILNYLLEKDSA